MGEAAQVPTQWSAGEAAAAMGASAQRESRRRNEILALMDMAFLGLKMIGSRLHLIVVSCRCFVEERGLTYSGEGRWSAGKFAARWALDQLAGRDG
jgi:hypothetical protein